MRRLSMLERRMAADMLRMAAEQFGNHGCNDFNLREAGLSELERRSLVAAMEAQQGIPEADRTTGDPLYVMDWMVMDYLASLLYPEAK